MNYRNMQCRLPDCTDTSSARTDRSGLLAIHVKHAVAKHSGLQHRIHTVMAK